MNIIIRQELKRISMSQKELANKLFVTPQAVSKWVNGESQPTFDNIQRMGNVFGAEFVIKVIKKKIIKERIVMDNETIELDTLNTIKKAELESIRLMEASGISNYSHATHILISWLLPAVIGLTYHQFINNTNKEYKIIYEDIFYNLNNFFEGCIKYPQDYRNELEYNFFLMGGDLFESFDENKLVNHDYAQAAMGYFYTFQKATNNCSSLLVDEFRIALAEIISKNSNY